MDFGKCLICEVKYIFVLGIRDYTFLGFDKYERNGILGFYRSLCANVYRGFIYWK